jgi:hypothetical protein
MYWKTIICLANSRKPPSGRCIAGKELLQAGIGAWVRPVSDRPTHEISEEERRYERGGAAQALDVVRVPLLEPRPMRHQTENHLIDDSSYWVKVRQATWNDLEAALDPTGVLWSDGSSTYHGLNDKVSDSQISTVRTSLRLVRTKNLVIHVVFESGFEGRQGRRRVRAAFGLGGSSYSLSVTDPKIEEVFYARNNGEYPIGDAIICVSLSELAHGYAFKLAASVFFPPSA